MSVRPTNLKIGALALLLVFGGIGGYLGLQKLFGRAQQVPLRVVFEGSASGLRKGGSVNFGGIRIGEVTSLKLDNPRRVIAMTRVDRDAPIRKDTLAGLEFQGLTGIASIALTGGSLEADPVPLDHDGIPVLIADPLAMQDVPEKIKTALKNVDQVIANNETELKNTLLNFESFSASLASSTVRIDRMVAGAASGVDTVDRTVTKTQDFLAALASDKNGDLLQTAMSFQELIESLDKKSGALMAEGRRMLTDISQSMSRANQKVVGGR